MKLPKMLSKSVMVDSLAIQHSPSTDKGVQTEREEQHDSSTERLVLPRIRNLIGGLKEVMEVKEVRENSRGNLMTQETSRGRLKKNEVISILTRKAKS
jgi:hypothetical protein